MLRRCEDKDFQEIYEIINDSARAYRNVIPPDRWNEPYMPQDELKRQIAAGVEFWCFEENGVIRGVMGIQYLRDVTLIRHAYVRTVFRSQGVGAQLLKFLLARTDKPVLIGTWQAADWAIRFYRRHGFRLLEDAEKDRLLREYWNIPERQIETSVVLADNKWSGRKVFPGDRLQLDEIFKSGRAPETADFDGVYGVDMLTGAPTLKQLNHRKFFYKENDRVRGYNLIVPNIKWGRFELRAGPCPHMERLSAVIIDYRRPGNSFITRPMIDYLRYSADYAGYLGRLHYFFRKRPRFIGYFSLIRKLG